MRKLLLLCLMLVVANLAFAEKYLEQTAVEDRLGFFNLGADPAVKTHGQLYNNGDLPYWMDSTGNIYNLLLGGSTSLNALSDVTLTAPVNGQALIYNSVSGQWENAGIFPNQAGNTGKFLQTDGTNVSWQEAASTLGELTDVTLTAPADGQIIIYNAVSGQWENVDGDFLPVQTGNANKILRTDGTDATWTDELQNWVSAKAYQIGDVVVESNKIYKCTVANSDAVFTVGNWVSIGGVSDHNTLDNLQGGIASEYYHLAQAAYDWVVQAVLNIGVAVDGTISALTANYETLVTSDNVLTNKKYVDDFATAISAKSNTSSVVSGCVFNPSSIGTTNITVNDCYLQFYDRTDPLNPVRTPVFVPSQTVAIPNIATQGQSYVTIDKTGTLAFNNVGVPDTAFQRANVYLGAIVHVTGVVNSLSDTTAVGSGNPMMALADIASVLGAYNYEGNLITPNATGFDKTAGKLLRVGINTKFDPTDENRLSVASCTNCVFTSTYKNPTGYTNTGGLTDLDAANYNDTATGTLATVGANRYSLRYVYVTGSTYIVQYGQARYDTINGAVDAVRLGGDVNYTVNPALAQTSFLGWIILRGNGSTDPDDWIFYSARPNTKVASSSSVTYNEFQVQEIDHTTNPNIITACNRLILANASGGAVTATLPDSTAGNNNCRNQFYLADNTNPLTVTTVGGTQDIGDATSQVISITDQAFTVVSNSARSKYLITQDSREAPSTIYVNSAVSNTVGALPTYIGDGSKNIQESAWTLIGNALDSATETALNFGKDFIASGIIKASSFFGAFTAPYNYAYQYGNESTAIGTSTFSDTGTTREWTALASGDGFEFPLVTIPNNNPKITAFFNIAVTSGDWTCYIEDNNGADRILYEYPIGHDGTGQLGITNNSITTSAKVKCTSTSAGVLSVSEVWWSDKETDSVITRNDSENFTTNIVSIPTVAGSTGDFILGFDISSPRINTTSELVSIYNSGNYTIIEALSKIQLDLRVSVQGDDQGQMWFEIDEDNNQLGYTNFTNATFKNPLTGNVLLNAGQKISVHASNYQSVNAWFNITATPQGANKGYLGTAEMPVNKFSARLANNGTASIASQSNEDNPAIASVSRIAAGKIQITYTSGFFSVTPAVVATAEDNNITVNVIDESETGCTVFSEDIASGVDADRDVSVAIFRQGSDYKKEPQIINAPVRVLENADLESYTPTFQGFGAVSNVDFQWKKDDGILEVFGKFTTGTPTASEAQISLPNGYVINSSSVASVRLVGYMHRQTSTTSQYGILATGGDSFLNVSVQSSGTDGLIPRGGTTIATTGNIFSFYARVPIQGWSAYDSVEYTAVHKSQIPKYVVGGKCDGSEQKIGEIDLGTGSQPVYKRCWVNAPNGVLTSDINYSTVIPIDDWAGSGIGTTQYKTLWHTTTSDYVRMSLVATDLQLQMANRTRASCKIKYIKVSETP